MTDGLLLGIDGGGSKVLVALAERSGRIVRTVRGNGVNPMDNRNWRAELAGAARRPSSASRVWPRSAPPFPPMAKSTFSPKAQRAAIADAFPGVPQTVINDVDARPYRRVCRRPRHPHPVRHRLDGVGARRRRHVLSRRRMGRRHRRRRQRPLDRPPGAEPHQPEPRWPRPPDGRWSMRRSPISVSTASAPVNALEGWVEGLASQRAGVASLAVVVDRVATDGDPAARDAHRTRRRTNWPSTSTAIAGHCGPDADWTYAGGAFASRMLLDAVTERIGRPPVPPRLPPIGGALLAAAMTLGWPIEAAFVEQLAVATTPRPPTPSDKNQRSRRQGTCVHFFLLLLPQRPSPRSFRPMPTTPSHMPASRLPS